MGILDVPGYSRGQADAKFAAQSTLGAGGKSSSTVRTATGFYLGTSHVRLLGTERGRLWAVVKAPAGQSLYVAAGALDSTTDPGTGYVEVTAGQEIVITDALPVWAYTASSSTTITIRQEVAA